MQYEVRIVEQSDLPEGTDMVIVDRGAESPVMLLGGRPAEAWLAMRAWEDLQEPCSVPSLLYAV